MADFYVGSGERDGGSSACIDYLRRLFPNHLSAEQIDPGVLTDFPKDVKVNSILVRRVFERLSTEEMYKFVAELELRLNHGGRIIIFIAHHDRTARLIKNSGDAAMPLVFGPYWKTYSNHITNYEPDTLVTIMEQFGFSGISVTENNWDYPCYMIIATKPKSLCAWEYNPITVERHHRVLEIGPGNNAWPRADRYFDIMRVTEDKDVINKLDIGDIERGTPYRDKEFDFIYCAHVFEHLGDPVKAAQEITRIGKAGVIITPSTWKDMLFDFEEKEHRWMVFPPKGTEKKMRFMALDIEKRDVLVDKDIQSEMCSIFRAGLLDTRGRRILRKWFKAHEKDLDVIHYWAGALEIEVV